MNQKRATSLVTAFRIYSHKAPVNIESAQRSANAMYHYIDPYLTSEEKSALSTALGHAELGEGREEFDRICKKIKERLEL